MIYTLPWYCRTFPFVPFFLCLRISIYLCLPQHLRVCDSLSVCLPFAVDFTFPISFTSLAWRPREYIISCLFPTSSLHSTCEDLSLRRPPSPPHTHTPGSLLTSSSYSDLLFKRFLLLSSLSTSFLSTSFLPTTSPGLTAVHCRLLCRSFCCTHARTHTREFCFFFVCVHRHCVSSQVCLLLSAAADVCLCVNVRHQSESEHYGWIE